MYLQPADQKDGWEAAKQRQLNRATEPEMQSLVPADAIVPTRTPRLATGTINCRQRCTESIAIQIPRPQDFLTKSGVIPPGQLSRVSSAAEASGMLPDRLLPARPTDSVLHSAHINAHLLGSTTWLSDVSYSAALNVPLTWVESRINEYGCPKPKLPIRDIGLSLLKTARRSGTVPLIP